MAAISVVYDHGTIASIGKGKQVTLHCENLRMRTNILITFGFDGIIKYGDNEIANVKGGQIAVLHCRDLKALNNITIAAVGYEAYERFNVTDKMYFTTKDGKVILVLNSSEEEMDIG